MNRHKEISIGQCIIGDDHPPYIIAEAGVHHYNSLELAKAYILAAKVAGADAIKFQTYSAERIATTWAPTYWDSPEGLTQFDIFADRSRLMREDYDVLFSFAHEVGVELLSTAFDPDSANLLAEFDMAAYKIASADLTYFPLLERIAHFGKPILLSTGAANLKEIEKTMEFLATLNAQVVLLHCVLSYPTPIKDANLQRIKLLQQRFPDVILGYSDHTQPQDSMLACPIAVSMGVSIVEKHLTLNKLQDGDDHYHAVDGEGLKRLVRDCKDAALMMQESTEILESEMPARTYARRSIVAAQSLMAGMTLTMENIDFKRPGTGLSPVHVDEVVGHVLNRDVAG